MNTDIIMKYTRSVFKLRTPLLSIAIVFFLAGLAAVSGVSAQEKGSSWAEMIRKERASLEILQREGKAFIEAQPQRIDRISRKTQQLNQELLRLSIRRNLEEGSPIEMRDILWQMKMIQDQGLALTAPVRDEIEYIKNLKTTLRGHLGEYEHLASDKSIPEASETITRYVADIKETIALLEKAESIIYIIPNTVEQLIVRLEPRRASIENDLRLAWKKYFIAQSSPNFFTSEAWQTSHEWLKNWAAFSTYFLIPYGENKSAILSALSRGTIFSIAILAALMLVMVHLGRKFPQVPVVKRFLPFCFCLAFGVPFMIISSATDLGPLSTLSFPAEILLAGGLVTLGWNLRRLSASDPAAFKHNPLWQFWVIFAAGIMAQLFHMPMIVCAPLFAFLFILAGICSYVLQRKDQHALDRKLHTITAWLSFTLAIVTFSGWGNLSVLAATVWFAIAMNIELGAGLAGCLRKIRALGKNGSTPTGRLAEGVAFPMIFLGLFAVTTLWITLYIGGMPLVSRIIQWRVIIGYLSLNLSMVIIIVAILFITRSFIVLVNALITFIAGRSGKEAVTEGVVRSLHSISSYVIWSLYILLSLKLIGVSVTHLTIVAGGLSIGAGFGLQDLIKNSFSGLILLFGRSIHPGDEIQLENVRGTVTRINIRNTIMQTNDDSTIFIPNSDLIYKNIVNWTYRDPRGRAEIAVGVAYGSDTDLVKELLIRCAVSHPGVLKEPPPYVLFWDFGENALAFRLRFWIMRPVQTRDKISSDIRFEIEKTFRENNVEIAFPQRDIHIRPAEGLKPCLKQDKTP